MWEEKPDLVTFMILIITIIIWLFLVNISQRLVNRCICQISFVFQNANTQRLVYSFRKNCLVLKEILNQGFILQKFKLWQWLSWFWLIKYEFQIVFYT